MSGWAAKRFWRAVSVRSLPEGVGIYLDDRPVRTPAKVGLLVPTVNLARAIAAEWEAQAGLIDPRTMPFTRSANAAIDKVGPQHAEVAGLIADYGDSDLICYRAEGPTPLVARQAAAWDPLVAWADGALGAPLAVAAGVVHVPQPADSLAALAAEVQAMDRFRLAALHDLVALSGSLVIGLAATRRLAPPETLWTTSRIDEDWQRELWGSDDEADAMAAEKREAFLHADRFFRLCEA